MSVGETVGREIGMNAAVTRKDVKQACERFRTAKAVQKDTQIEYVAMHFSENDLKELIYMLDMLKAYMDAEVEG